MQPIPNTCQLETARGLQGAAERIDVELESDELERLTKPVAAKLLRHFAENPGIDELVDAEPFKSFLKSFHEAQLYGLLTGRSIPNMDWLPTLAELERPSLHFSSTFEEVAGWYARNKFELSDTDAAIVAETVAIATEHRVNVDLDLYLRFLREPRFLFAYIRVAVRRAASRHAQRADALEKELRTRHVTDLRVGRPTAEEIDERDRAIDWVHQAIEDAGLTEIEQHRLTEYLSQNMPNLSEIARQEGVSEGAVRASIRNAKKKIREYAEREDAPKAPQG